MSILYRDARRPRLVRGSDGRGSDAIATKQLASLAFERFARGR
jgi:hypothetical protein